MNAEGALRAAGQRFDPSRGLRLARVRSSDTPPALVFLAPAMLGLFALRLWPFGRAINDSVHSATFSGGGGKYVGLQNYHTLLSDPGFHQSLKVTALFALVANPLQIALALALAVVLSEKLPAVGLLRTLIFLPVAVPPAVGALIWGVALRQDGPINAFLGSIGVHAQPFFNSSSQALWSIVLLASWVGVGYWMIFLLAGLKNIPRSYYEAAAIDGVGRWRTFLQVTLPLLRRPLAFVLVSDTISNALVFAPVQILTNGGPNGSTNLVMYDIFYRAYSLGNLSLASAETVILALIVLVVVAVEFRLISTRS